MLQMMTQSTIPTGTAVAANSSPRTTFSGSGRGADSGGGGVKDMDKVPPTKEITCHLP